MSSPLEKGRAKGAGWICPAGASFYVADNVLLAGIVSHAWYEILRLSPHLFWLGVFTHGAFSSAQDDDTRGRMVSHLVQGSGFKVEVAASPPFLLGDARKWYSSHGLPVITTI